MHCLHGGIFMSMSVLDKCILFLPFKVLLLLLSLVLSVL